MISAKSKHGEICVYVYEHGRKAGENGRPTCSYTPISYRSESNVFRRIGFRAKSPRFNACQHRRATALRGHRGSAPEGGRRPPRAVVRGRVGFRIGSKVSPRSGRLPLPPATDIPMTDHQPTSSSLSPSPAAARVGLRSAGLARLRSARRLVGAARLAGLDDFLAQHFHEHLADAFGVQIALERDRLHL